MTEIALFGSVLGVRPGVHAVAQEWRAAGHRVHVLDVYDGRVFDDYAEAGAFVEGFGGYPELLRRAAAAADGLPAELVCAGFSNGGGCAAYLAATRPGARGALLLHAALPLAVLSQVAGTELRWPADVPVQVHYGRDDPFRDERSVAAFTAEVRASGAPFEYREYPVAGHLFADPGLPAEYDPAAAAELSAATAAFLRRVDGRSVIVGS
jgi:dienelactone hydrolase